jgi:hypothetical protein
VIYLVKFCNHSDLQQLTITINHLNWNARDESENESHEIFHQGMTIIHILR